jgi:phage terminase large subunit-like protein
MPEIEVVFPYVPFAPHQTALHLSDAKIRAAITGAQAGKTRCGCAETIDYAIRQPDYSPEDIVRGMPYTMVIGAPTYPVVRRVILPTFLELVPKPLIVGDGYHEGRHLLRIRGVRGESHVYFLSAKLSETWQGMTLYWIWLDEFPLLREQMYDEALTRLNTRGGKLLLTGTPRGPANWAKARVYDRRGTGELEFFTWRTADNPYYPRQELERLKKLVSPKYYRRIHEGDVLTSFEGQVYEMFIEAIHIRRASEYSFELPDGTRLGAAPQRVKLKSVIAGVDWGYGPNNPGAIVVLGVTPKNTWWVLDVVRETGLVVMAVKRQSSWVRHAQMLRARWGIQTFYCDPSSPDHVAQLVQNGLPAEAAYNEVEEGIESVARLMAVDEDTEETSWRVLDTCKAWLEEVRYYHRDEQDRIVKKFDHTQDATRYAVYTYRYDGVFDRERGFTPSRRGTQVARRRA